MEYLFYAPFIGLIILFWYFGSKIFQSSELSIKNRVIDEVKDEEINTIKFNLIDTKLDEIPLNRFLNDLKGHYIKKVLYLNINYEEYEFTYFDSVDLGVAFQFDNGKWLNWLFSSGDQNHHIGYYMDLNDIYKHLDNSFQPIDVTYQKKWTRFKNMKINDINITRVNSEEDQICQKMILNFYSGDKIGVFSVVEPEIDEDNVINVSLDFEVDWTVIVFDQDLIAENLQ